LTQDVAEEEGGIHPVEEFASRVPPENILRKVLKTCIALEIIF